MRVLLDQGVQRRAAALLREAGVDALHVADLGMSSADDADILAWCRQHGAVAVTLDADFHAAIALSGETTPSAIRLRVQGLKGPEVARLLQPSRREETAVNPLVNTISGRLSLRPPQREAPARLARAVEIAPPTKTADPVAALEVIRSEFPSVTSFERDFPSLCFAPATGVGKTRCATRAGPPSSGAGTRPTTSVGMTASRGDTC